MCLLCHLLIKEDSHIERSYLISLVYLEIGFVKVRENQVVPLNTFFEQYRQYVQRRNHLLECIVRGDR